MQDEYIKKLEQLAANNAFYVSALISAINGTSNLGIEYCKEQGAEAVREFEVFRALNGSSLED